LIRLLQLPSQLTYYIIAFLSIDIAKPRDRESMTVSPGPSEFLLAKDNEEEDAQVKRHAANAGEEQVSAADYDPSLDRREDEHKRFVNGRGDEGQVIPFTIEDEEMEEAEDDVDDMFAVTAVDSRGVGKVKKQKTVVVGLSLLPAITPVLTLFVQKPAAPALITMTNLDSAADPEGYYTIILGEQLDAGRYQVFSSIGKGMFANVVRARVLTGEDMGKEVAIKIVRSQESMCVPILYPWPLC
jgi:serine/threonine-protein kinase PRP4